MSNKRQKQPRRQSQKKDNQKLNSLNELATKVVKEVTEEFPKPGDTRAGAQEYSDFFGLYAKSIREKKAFRSLGYIPGPAIILEFREGGEIRVLAATSDVAQKIGTIPTNWMSWEDLPKKIQLALAEHKSVVDGLSYEPSPYNLGLAKKLLEEKAPSKYLSMTMIRFRYRPGDPEKPFGVVLLPITEGGVLAKLKVKTYNPGKIPDVPQNGTLMSLAELKDGRGPVQKTLRTWALMEENYFYRYDRGGNRRNNRPQKIR